MGINCHSHREALSRLRGECLKHNLMKHCWQEGTFGFGGGIGPGPHFRRPDCQDVVSPSEEELMVLFTFARALAPRVIVEFGTGTGCSTACLAMGAPQAQVFSADLSSPSDLSETCQELWKRLGLKNIKFFKEDWKILPELAVQENWEPGLIFADGFRVYPEVPGFPGATPTCTYVFHDFSSSEYAGSPQSIGWWALNSSTLLAFFSPDPGTHALLPRLASLQVPAERIQVWGK